MTNQEAIKTLKENVCLICAYGGKNIDECDIRYCDNREALNVAIEALEKQKTGHWIGHKEHCENLGVMPSGLGAYEWCSNCNCGIDVKEWHRNNYNYCPNCGAEMKGGQNDS